MNLREAAQQALEALEQFGLNDERRSYEQERAAITALRAALADGDKLSPGEPVTRLFGTLPVYDTPPKREPLTDCGDAGHNEGRCGNASCITPIKREPLTDEEIHKLAKTIMPVSGAYGLCELAALDAEKSVKPIRNFVRAIEQAHGIGGKK